MSIQQQSRAGRSGFEAGVDAAHAVHAPDHTRPQENHTMHIFSRIGMISAVSAAWTLGPGDIAHAKQPAAASQPRQASAAPGSHAIIAVTDAHEFRPADAAGHYLALHFLTAADTAEGAGFVREYLEHAPTVAGVRHVFIRPDDAAAAKTWAAQFGPGADLIFVDPAGALARDLDVPTGLAVGPSTSNFSTTVVLGPGGEELFRHVGRSAQDYLAFDAFARQMTDTTRHPALADYNLPNGNPLAVEGYDVVAYFTRSKAVKGSAALASSYRAVTYQFATDENRRLFAASPEDYLPTYGGWCASAMGAKGAKVEIDPTSFKVKNGRLFLFYKSLFGDALKDWNKNEREWEPAADSNWKKLTNEDAVVSTK